MFEYAFGPPLAILLGLTMKGQINSVQVFDLRVRKDNHLNCINIWIYRGLLMWTIRTQSMSHKTRLDQQAGDERFE